MERFEKTVYDVLRALVACGERLSNEAEERAFDVLEAAYRRAGAQTHRERIPIFFSTADASIRAGAAAIESPEVEGNAMTHPLEDGAPGDFTISAKGPLLALDRQAREALARGEAAVDGAVLLVEGLPSLGLLRAAQAAGAAALLFNTGERVRRMIVSDLWGSPAGDEDIARYVRIPNAAVTDAAAKRLLAAAQTGLGRDDPQRGQQFRTAAGKAAAPFGRLERGKRGGVVTLHAAQARAVTSVVGDVAQRITRRRRRLGADLRLGVERQVEPHARRIGGNPLRSRNSAPDIGGSQDRQQGNKQFFHDSSSDEREGRARLMRTPSPPQITL